MGQAEELLYVDNFEKAFDRQRFDEEHRDFVKVYFVKVHNKLVGMGYIKQHYGQQGIGKEDFARPYVKEKKLWKVIRNATIRQKSA